MLASQAVAGQGLEITEIRASVDYDDSYIYNVENRDRITSDTVAISNKSKINVEILPGSNLTLTVRLENTFNGESPTIRNAVARVFLKDIDDGSDLEEESQSFDIDPGNDVLADINFRIPLDVESGTYEVELEAEGEGKNDTTFETELDLQLEVRKLSHDIRITKTQLSPSIVACDRKSRITAEIFNAGRNAENEIAIEIRNPNLGINSAEKDISLLSSPDSNDNEKTYVKTLNFEVPSFFKPGAYPFTVNIYWKNFILFDQRKIDLIVNDCSANASNAQQPIRNESNESTIIVNTIDGLTSSEEGTTSGTITASREAGFDQVIVLSSVVFGGFAILIFIILAVIGYRRTMRLQ